MKEAICQYCGEVFFAKRNDAKRCKDCHRIRRSNHQKSVRGRMLRAKNHRRMRETAFAGYGAFCNCCGEDIFEFLALDHVNGGGSKERKTKSTGQIAREVINKNFPPEYQVLCHNCNCAKGWYGICPHKSWTRTS